MASDPLSSWQLDGEEMETVTDFIVLDFKITADSGCSHEIQRRRALWKKSYDKPRQCIKKQRLTLSTKVYIDKAMVFPVVM